VEWSFGGMKTQRKLEVEGVDQIYILLFICIIITLNIMGERVESSEKLSRVTLLTSRRKSVIEHENRLYRVESGTKGAYVDKSGLKADDS